MGDIVPYLKNNIKKVNPAFSRRLVPVNFSRNAHKGLNYKVQKIIRLSDGNYKNLSITYIAATIP